VKDNRADKSSVRGKTSIVLLVLQEQEKGGTVTVESKSWGAGLRSSGVPNESAGKLYLFAKIARSFDFLKRTPC
jgi:hypothetical protein